VTSGGSLQIGAYDHRDGEIERITLEEDWGADDHNTGSILVLPDRRLMVFYAQHNGHGLYCRRSMRPEEIGAWEEEVTVTNSPRVTYSHPVYLDGEKRIYVFWRGVSWKPTFSTSVDGKHWTESRVLLQERGRESGDIRPYLKVISDGRASIHFAFTDGHPRNEPENSIYYLRYERGRFTKADGTPVGMMDSLPIRHSSCDLVYDGKATGVRSWVWDIALDADGRPCVAYTRLPEEWDHRYHYARWTGEVWNDREITQAGRWFPQTPQSTVEPEPHYSGGIVLNQSNPSIVYLSRQADSVFEIQKCVTEDLGDSWSLVPVAGQSRELNVRPVFPYGYTGTGEHLLWMSGAYVHYTDYRTRIMMLK
jgi:hypothetical protein